MGAPGPYPGRPGQVQSFGLAKFKVGLGFGGETSFEKEFYGGMKLHVVKMLNMKAIDDLEVSVSRILYPSSFVELEPEINGKYLVFVEQLSPEQLRVVKMLHPMDENLRLVATLLNEPE